MAIAQNRKPWTADELCRLPEGWRYEIDEGELVIMSPSGPRHADLVAGVIVLLRSFVRENRLGNVYGGELGVYLTDDPETLRGVDVAFYENERLAQVKDEVGFTHIPPDIAIEIHDSTELGLRRKVAQYLTAGVRSVWVIDPDKKTLTKHSPAGDVMVVSGLDDLVKDDVLPGFSCRLKEIFGEG